MRGLFSSESLTIKEEMATRMAKRGLTLNMCQCGSTTFPCENK